MQLVRWSLLLAFVLFVNACSRSPEPAASDTQTTSPQLSSATPPTSDKPAASNPAPDWTLKDLNGKTVSLSDFKGKVVVLDFWATWCPPCVAEIPRLIELQTEFKDKGVTLVGISLDSTEPSDVAKFVKDNGMNYPIVMADEKTATAYGADQGIPLTVVIDVRGNIVATHLGPTAKETLEGEIKKALAQ